MGSRARFPSSLIVCVVYLGLHLAAHFSAAWFEVSPGISIWYPPCGLALSLLVLLGPHYAPVVLAVNLLTAVGFSEVSVWWAPVAFSALITLNYTGAAWVSRRFLGPLLLPGSPKATFLFALIIAAAPAALALAGTGLLLALGFTTSDDFLRSALNWWVGDVSGLLTVVPAAMVFVAPWLRGERIARPPQAKYAIAITALQAAALLGCLLLVFVVGPLLRYNAFYLCFLPLVWICFRHGLAGATLASLAITMVSLVCLHIVGSSPDLTLNFLLFELAIACVGLGLGSTVTRRGEAERSLVTSEAATVRLLEVLEVTTDFVATTDADLRILYANTALLRLAGKPSLAALRNQPLTGLFTPPAAHLLQQEAVPAALASGIWNGETVLLDNAGAELPVSLVVLTHRDKDSGTITLSLVLRSIARQKQAEAGRLEGERRLLQVQKLESLGVLAGGIAHDFNNLLTPLMGYASLVRLDLPDDSPLHKSLGKIEDAAKRAAALCQQMLAYAGRSPLALGETDLNRLIQDTTQLLRLSAGKRALDFELSPSLPPITADPTQMRQILMNLVLNASEAIGNGSGSITVRTRSVSLASAATGAPFQGRALPAGSYVVLEVQDDGCGMTPETQARIFEPFFTTKFTGHGLGLAAVLGIVKSHHGAIHVESAPDSGSLFRLFFPALATTAAEPVEAPPVHRPWRGSGTVLLVDDEEEVRTVIAHALTACGFESIEAVDGLDAVEIFRKNPAGFRLVLLDLTMPRMDGEQAFLEMQRIAPAVPVILMSGYSEKLCLERFAHARPAAFLPKPFNFEILREHIRQLPAFRNG